VPRPEWPRQRLKDPMTKPEERHVPEPTRRSRIALSAASMR
jgi:hypothetical protein